jgi:hypothetical protein
MSDFSDSAFACEQKQGVEKMLLVIACVSGTFEGFCGCWFGFVGVGLVLWVLVWFCGCWFGFVGVGLVLWVLVWFCGCWFCCVWVC